MRKYIDAFTVMRYTGIFIIVAVVAVFSLITKVTIAYLGTNDSAKNTVNVGYGDVSIDESFEEPSELSMENDITKQVKIQNRSTVPAFVRVYAEFADSSLADKAKVTYGEKTYTEINGNDDGKLETSISFTTTPGTSQVVTLTATDKFNKTTTITVTLKSPDLGDVSVAVSVPEGIHVGDVYEPTVTVTGTDEPYSLELLYDGEEEEMPTSAGTHTVVANAIFEDNPTFIQVKVPRNDGTDYADYLLSGLDITAIAIDGGGRKWFGTNGNGAYLISADNMTQVQHFTTTNSKLLSDVVQSIAIDPKSGEVFFGTEQGLCSYMSDATAPAETMDDDHVYAYPNPVDFSNYSGLITVTGLTFNADVKITNAAGFLVAEGRSNGGLFTWDGKDKKGTVCRIAIVK